MSSRGLLTETAASKVMLLALDALHYLHLNGVIHRDIKPENALVITNAAGELERLLIFDFGLSIQPKEERPVTRLGTTPCELKGCLRICVTFLCRRFDSMVCSDERSDLGSTHQCLVHLVYTLAPHFTPLSRYEPRGPPWHPKADPRGRQGPGRAGVRKGSGRLVSNPGSWA